MVFRFKYFFYWLLVVAGVVHAARPVEKLQVVAERRHVPYGKSLLLHSEHGFHLVNPESIDQAYCSLQQHLTIRVQQEGLYVNDKWCLASELFITPVHGAFILWGARHYGTLHIKLDAIGMQVVSCASKKAHNAFYFSDWLPCSAGHQVLAQPLIKNTRKKVKRAKVREHENSLEQFSALQADTASVSAGRVSLVRVLLDSWGQQEKRNVTLKCPKGFVLVRKTGKKIERTLLKETVLVVSRQQDRWVVGNKKYVHEKITLIPQEGTIKVDDKKEYAGSLQLVKDGQLVRLINCLDIEQYLFCVLRTEGWPGWPLEVYKALAIACRTYVIAMAREAKATGRCYHVQNSNIHQTYAGWHGVTRLKDAVDQTKGIFLAYNNRPIVAMYDSCCGGVVPAHLEGVDFKKAPYLARKYPCTHCKSCSIYQWRAEYDLDDLHAIVREHIPEFQNLRKCAIATKDKAGAVQELALDDGECRWLIPGKKVYSMLSDVKSFCFSVKKKADKVVFEGRGFGHHLGLCQWGAREMVRNGWDYQRLLQFYYPGTTFMKM